MNSLTQQEIFDKFKDEHPVLIEDGIVYRSPANSIIITIPSKGVLLYEGDENEITWLDRRNALKEIRRLEENTRASMYNRFCIAVKQYMRSNKLTQKQFCDLAGISRPSLISYLSGNQIPKVNTMKYVCENVGIDI